MCAFLMQESEIIGKQWKKENIEKEMGEKTKKGRKTFELKEARDWEKGIKSCLGSQNLKAFLF